MSFRESYDFGVLVNEAERMVVDELERRLTELDDPTICVCEDCILDMAAFALNTLRPVYRVSLLGTMYAHAMDNGEYAAELRKAVDAGIAKVHANPSHD
ncbi:MAG TPA: late competence development ComFB family protein [Rectinemataceae bacterium]|nr:late competence development ComFB family protein [Rectinemataceae bacterium]